MSLSILSDINVIARKDHRCIWCGQKILTGEFHRHAKLANGREFHDQRWHLECGEAASEMSRIGERDFDACENRRPGARKEEG